MRTISPGGPHFLERNPPPPHRHSTGDVDGLPTALAATAEFTTHVNTTILQLIERMEKLTIWVYFLLLLSGAEIAALVLLLTR